MERQKAVRWLGGTLAVAGLGTWGLSLPGLLLRPRVRRVEMGGIVTLEDAVAACERTGLRGWELVAYAQRLVARKFTAYSLRNPWDTPARAFERGMGFCLQYNPALQQLLRRLGVEARLVHAFRVRDVDNPRWKWGHAWLKVRVGGEERDVCAGHPDNTPGHTRFEPVTPVHELSPLAAALSRFGSGLFGGSLEWWTVLTGRRPGLTFAPRSAVSISGLAGPEAAPVVPGRAHRTMRRLLGGLCFLSGVTASWGGVELFGWPEGGAPGFTVPLSVLEHTPFRDFFVPGLLLFSGVGIPNLVAGALALRRPRWSEVFAFGAGSSLTVWIVTEMAMLRSFHWLHGLYLAVGLGTQATALWLWRHEAPMTRHS
ncbi:transglutaminase-like domain-containing protein [Hyalangium gracile]|uniref:transglutaminase-like domain-containing protein n=1 Tax=Hyalangium gracile TaxID=394092 RepID=UPI001CCB823F|nr:transglutaminase-like domain-containing protein [Hyalangium gracile]